MLQFFWKGVSKSCSSVQRSTSFKEHFLSLNICPDLYISNSVKMGFGTQVNGLAYIQTKKEAPVGIGEYLKIEYNPQ